jgi:ligand-binding SRPBCC domain-containing protein
MKIYTLKRQQLIRRPIDEVFQFFSQPVNLSMMTPASLRFRLITPPPIAMKESAVFDYTIGLRGIPVRWTTLITAFTPNHRFVDLQLRGPYAYWHHTHTFTETDDGTLVTDEVHYALPFGYLGRFVHAFFVRRQLDMIFGFRSAALRKIFPDPPAFGHNGAPQRSAHRATTSKSRRKNRL